MVIVDLNQALESGMPSDLSEATSTLSAAHNIVHGETRGFPVTIKLRIAGDLSIRAAVYPENPVLN